MLNRQLGAHLRHRSVLRRHLVQRRAAALDVQGTTPIPFLRRVGMIETPVRVSGPQLSIRESFSFSAPEEDIVEPVFASEILQEKIGGELQTAIQPVLPPEILPDNANEPSPRIEAEKVASARTIPTPVPTRIENSKAPAIQQTPKLAQVNSYPAKPARIPESKTFVPKTAGVQLSGHPGSGHIRVADPATDGAPVPVPRETDVEVANGEVPASIVRGESASPLVNVQVPASPAAAAPKIPTRRTLLDRVAEIISGTKTTSTAPEIPRIAKSEPAKSEASSHSEVKKRLVPSEHVAADAESISEMQGAAESLKATAATPAVPAPTRRAQIEEVSKSKTASESTKEVAKSRPRPAKPSGPPWSWKNQADAAPESSEAAELFAPRTDVDSSTAAWRERLAEAIRVETGLHKPSQPTQRSAPRPAASKLLSPARPAPVRAAVRSDEKPTAARLIAKPTPMSESARRFLTPLVGFDPREVKVHQGPAVSRVLAAANADAIAEDESVLLGPGHDESSQQTLGLLAHELTHVARGRNAVFVPPVLRPVARGEQKSTSQTARAAEMHTPSSPLTTDEETIARRVEKAAQTTAERVGIAGDDSYQTPNTSPAQAPSSFSRDVPVNLERSERDSNDKWGGLPAPWEPMPEWIRGSESPGSASTPDISISALSTPGPDLSSSATSVPAPARAEVERSLPDEDSASASGQEEAEHTHKKVSPDLDALAKQVYTIMRQRLAADRRREYMY